MENWYYGLADCHGVESFVLTADDLIYDIFVDAASKSESKSNQFAMCMRAQANQQRHAVVYMVRLKNEDAEEIEETIKAGDYMKALMQIKANALETRLGTYATNLSAAKKNWDMIPNPDLDPYHK
jgi:hypothetical protein